MQGRSFITLLALLMAMALVLTACGGYGRERDTATGEVTDAGAAQTGGQAATSQLAVGGETTEAGTKLKVGETGLLGGAKVTINRVWTDFSPLGEDRVLILMEMAVENPTQESFAVNSLSWFRIVDPDGNTSPVNATAIGMVGTQIDGSVPAGETREGGMGFDVVYSDREFTLQITRPGVQTPLEYVFTVERPME